jgi:hypothetical protein
MLTPDWNPNRRTLRQFALLALLFSALVGLLRAWKGGALASGVPPGFHGPWLLPLVVWTVGGVVAVLGAIEPRLVRPVYLALLAISFPIGWVLSHVLLGVLYFGVFTPLAVLFRLLRRDHLKRRFDRDATTYWRDRRPAPDPPQYFRLS